MTSIFADLMGSSEEQKQEASLSDQFNKECSLSYTTRLYGFGIFFAIGVVLTVISAFMTPNLITGHPERFALPYAFGAVCSLLATMFLMGPWKQIKSMFERKRVVATCVYLGSIVLTIVLALTVGNVILVLLAIIIQMLALFWYSISYIPYARTAICSCCKSMVSV